MAENIKMKTLRLYKEKKEREKEKDKLLEQLENNENDFDSDNEKKTENESSEENEQNKNINQNNDESNDESNEKKISENESLDTDDDSGTEHESDDSLLDDEIDENQIQNLKTPFFYIDYDEGNVEIAKNFEYDTLLVNRKEGLTEELIKSIISKKLFQPDKTHLIINCWKVLTKSNLNMFSYDCTEVSDKKFQKKMEDKIKWGSKPYLKGNLTIDEKREYTPFRDGIHKLLKSIYHYGVKIFIVSNSDYSFVKRLFEYYNLDKYVEAFFTPSVCGLPSGKITHDDDSYKDRRKINKARVFVCIERYLGRLPIKS